MPGWSRARTCRGRGKSPGTRRLIDPRCLAILTLIIAASSPVVPCEPLQEDLDDSGVVDFPDFLIFVSTFNNPAADPAFNPRADFNNDGLISFNDFLLLADAFGSVAPDVGNGVGNGLEIVHGPDGPEGADRDNPFRSLTVHPDDPNTVLLGTERNGFVRSSDGGQTWTRHRTGLRHQGELYPEVWDIVYDPADPDIIYAATLDSPGPVTGDYPSSIGGVYRSDDGGDTWTRSNCGLESSRITSITAIAGDSTVVIAGVEGGTASFQALQGEFFGGGLYRSVQGQSWQRSVTAVDDSTNGYRTMITRGDTLVTFGLNLEEPESNGGFLKSLDGGTTWETFAESLQKERLTSFAVSADGTTIVGNIRDSFRLEISRDGGATWTQSEINQANGPVAIHPGNNDRILFVAGQNELRLSTDGLDTHEAVLVTDGNVAEIVFAPSDPTIVYVTCEGSSVYRSEDSGTTFTRIANIRTDVLN